MRGKRDSRRPSDSEGTASVLAFGNVIETRHVVHRRSEMSGGDMWVSWLLMAMSCAITTLAVAGGSYRRRGAVTVM